MMLQAEQTKSIYSQEETYRLNEQLSKSKAVAKEYEDLTKIINKQKEEIRKLSDVNR